MKIGFVQMAPKLGDPEATQASVADLLGRAPETDLLVLPELCNSGYNFESREAAVESSEVIRDSAFVRLLQDDCSRNGRHIVSGICERDGDDLYNSAVLVGPGGVIGVYRKLHLFLNEFDYFRPGNLGLPVFDIGPAKVGILICFDWIFPEAWRVLGLEGADIICHPSNLVLPSLAQRAVPVHAVINGVYAVTANRIGTERELTFTGCSLIASPKGEVLVEAGPSEPAVKVVEIDISAARNKTITARNDRFGDRRPELYRQLCVPKEDL